MKYSIDFEEEKKGYEIIQDIESAIESAKEDFRYGNCSYGEMMYKIGELMYIAGAALYNENRYADKEDFEDSFVDDKDLDQEIRDWVKY